MQQDLRSTLKKVADRTMELSFQYRDGDILDKEAKRWHVWDWSIGVGFYGVWQAYEVWRDAAYPNRIKEYVDHRIDRDQVGTVCVNTNALMTSVLKLMENDPNEKYEKLCGVFDRYVLDEAPRTPSGAVAHTVIQKAYDGEVWADTLFMSILYLAERGIRLGDERYIREAVRQLSLHTELLADSADGLYWHGWDDTGRQPLGVKWGRGNAWVTASTVEILEALGDIPEKTLLLQRLNRQIDALARHQDESGLWRTVLDHPDTYVEASATAGFAYGILKGIRLGWVDTQHKPMAVRALDGLLKCIDEAGNVLKGSTGTPIKANALEYNQIPYNVTPFSQGLAMMAITEAIRAQ